jgi:superfamily II DNA or RNA helicase
LQDRFSTKSRSRGTQYFIERRVDVRLTTPTEVCAVVEGTERYATVLHWTGERLAALCSCPYFVDHGEMCKHLWATLLAADAGDYLPDARNAPKLNLDVDLLLEAAESSPSALFDDPDVIVLPFERKERASRAVRPPAPPRPPAWKTQLSRIADSATLLSRLAPPAPWPSGAEIVYILEVGKGVPLQSVVLSVATRERRKDGGWKYVAKPWAVYRQKLASVPHAEDREILSLLAGGGHYSSYSGSYDPYDHGAETFALSAAMARTVLPLALETGRCFLPFDKDETQKAPLRWDRGEPWRLTLEVLDGKNGWELTGAFRRVDQRLELRDAILVTQGGTGSGGGTGFLVTRDWVGRLADDRGLAWMAELRQPGRITVPKEDGEEFLNSLLASPHLPEIDLPDELRYEEAWVIPRRCLTVAKPKYSYGADRLEAKLSFDYEGHSVTPGATAGGIYEQATRRFIRRDPAAEAAAAAQLSELGLRANSHSMEPGVLTLAPTKLPKVARALVVDGWHLVAEGKVFRQPGASSVSVVSGVDWFELHGEVDYGGTVARLPQLLAALKRGETMVTLDDGSFGLLPEEWLRRFAGVAAMGEAEGDHLQFRRSQAGLLDALLSAQPAVDCDEQFRQVRRQLERFESVAAADQPAGFQGILRGYQREGLGWMHFLRQFNFGGCLADDMGVGKTAQVLALLETRRELREQGEIDAPSLVVLPKSLIFNWKQEIERFTPRMRVLDYTGIARGAIDPAACDLILTTYGTLRRDVAQFAEYTFDYLILDEAQAIKNARTESAKAARLLRGNHRLAMSGTPVENHLGELWSLFEFLNPGMLGASSVFQGAAKEMRDPSSETSEMLSKALRPFLLRRTKEQVATELPAKVEQTLYCEMEPKQRALYDELRKHYRDSLLGKIQRDGMAKSKIQVLEALLRLRQAACHPGLVDRARGADPSAKFDVLLDSLRDVVAEGHKALVFSQFTTLLGFLGKRLLADGLAYEYLDGKTADRQVPVERFQNDPNCRLFLISLKAGGVGLNLTAADYVFILDPWWNPAVEAQAVDRAHRIGQLRQVFAYRLIARDTVEEKILQLQQSKRNVADAILGEDKSLIGEIGQEDIELLLS